MNSPLIFCHYGNAAYLQYTLRCARRTNPTRDLVLLGDAANKAVAAKEGWTHFDYRDFRADMHGEFEQVYQPVQGKEHSKFQMRGGKDWLRFVFERWYHIEGFTNAHAVDRFWHFDSDTMVLEDLGQYENALAPFDYSLQCNATCLNGYIKRSLLKRYNANTISLFQNQSFLDRQQTEFDTQNPSFAFTEMRAFNEFTSTTDAKGIHLMDFSPDEVFDDALRQAHGFDTKIYDKEKFVKDIRFINGRIIGIRDGHEVAFATLNMSWLPILAYRWVLRALNGSTTPLVKPLSSKLRRELGY